MVKALQKKIVSILKNLIKKNLEKEQFNFHPLGQGRLAIVYFTDSSEYETVYKDKDGTYQKRTIPYPNTSDGLFNFDDICRRDARNKRYLYQADSILKQTKHIRTSKNFFL